jgi:hypothetical protein
MTDDEFRALVEAGPCVVMVAKSDMLRLLDERDELRAQVAPPPPPDKEAELRRMMRDPRYWRQREPEFVRKVSEGFRALIEGGQR